MNRLLCLFLAAALTLCLCMPALAVDNAIVYTTDNVNLRQGPGQKYKKVGSLIPGTGLEFMGKISTDDAGADWYQVRYYGEPVWISSNYSYLDTAELQAAYGDDYLDLYDDGGEVIPLATPQAAITAVPSFDDEATAEPTFSVPGLIELAPYYHASLKSTAGALSLTGRRRDETGRLHNMYYNDVLLIGGNRTTEHMRLSGSGYSIFGVYVGMDLESARAVLNAAGLTQSTGTMGLYFEHPSSSKSKVNVNGYDSGLSVLTDGSGLVSEISWTTLSA